MASEGREGRVGGEIKLLEECSQIWIQMALSIQDQCLSTDVGVGALPSGI